MRCRALVSLPLLGALIVSLSSVAPAAGDPPRRGGDDPKAKPASVAVAAKTGGEDEKNKGAKSARKVMVPAARSAASGSRTFVVRPRQGRGVAQVPRQLVRIVPDTEGRSREQQVDGRTYHFKPRVYKQYRNYSYWPPLYGNVWAARTGFGRYRPFVSYFPYGYYRPATYHGGYANYGSYANYGGYANYGSYARFGYGHGGYGSYRLGGYGGYGAFGHYGAAYRPYRGFSYSRPFVGGARYGGFGGYGGY